MASGGYISEAHRKALQDAGALPGTAITQTYSTAATSHPAVTTNTITDSTGGTASTSTLVAISGTYTQSEIRNNMATLAAELALTKADLLAVKKLVNQIVDDLQAYGIQS